MKHLAGISVCLLLLAIHGITARAGLAQTSGDVRVRLSLAGDRTVYRMGEPIRLVLSFTAGAEGYVVNTTTTKPASPVDAPVLSPEVGVYHWLDQYSGLNRYFPDYSTLQALSAAEVRVVLPLNDWFRFDQPGRYTVRIKTYRVSRPVRPALAGAAIPLVTNEVSFEIKPMTEQEEETEVRRLSAALDATREVWTEAGIAEELSYLAGDASTREKVRRFPNPEGRSGNYGQNIYFGLFIARNRALVLRLLEAAFRDPGTEVTHQLLMTLTRLRLLEGDASAKPAAPADKKQAARQAQERSSVIEQAYASELVASLPRRTGKSRTTAAMTILGHMPKDEGQAGAILGDVREILLEEFGNLHPFDQEYLLRVYWEKLRDPVLVPVLKRMLENNHGQSTQNARTTALERLMEMAPDEARPFVIAEIRDPTSLVDFNVLKGLKDTVLSETDAALVAQIRELAPLKQPRDSIFLRQKALLAARYASPAVYQPLLEIYQKWGARWPVDSIACLLGYFARYDEQQAVPMIQQALAKAAPGHDLQFFDNLTRVYFSDAIDNILRARLDSDDPQAVSTAAYIMSRHGPATDQEWIKARLDRWVSEWGGRAAELDVKQPDGKNVVQAMVQVNLIISLTRATSWKLPEARARELQQSCITEICRRSFPPR